MKKELFIVFLIFLCICSIRIFLSLSVPEFSNDNSYYVLRQVEHISHTGVPIIHDDLSYSGRTYYFLPVFYYILAFFNLFMPLILVCKIIPNLFAASIVFIVYLIGLEITKNKEAALFTSFMSGIIPVFLSETVYSLSVYSLVVPLFLTLIYCLIKISKLHPAIDAKKIKIYKFLYVVFLVLFAFLHQSVILFVFFTWIYLFIISIEGLKVSKAEHELIIFGSFFIVWAFLVTMKNVFFEHGFSVIFGGIPYFIRSYYFSDFTFLESIYKLGIIPVIYGLYSIFRFTFGKRERYVYMLVSLIYLMLVLLWFKIISFNTGLIFLGTFLMIVVLLHYDWVFDFFNSNNRKSVRTFVKVIFITYYIVSFTISSVLPSVTYLSIAKSKVPESAEIDMFKLMNDEVLNSSIIVAIPDYGQKIAYYSGKRTIMDSYYFGAKESNRLLDLQTIYTTSSLSTAAVLFDKYDADYILVSSQTKKLYNSSFPAYIDSTCFELIKQINDVSLFKIKCKVISYES
jgi:hypothetical protein